jgi:hypothetical protein
MGHADINRTYATYGGWVREMGAETAALREAWLERKSAERTIGAPDTPQSGS